MYSRHISQNFPATGLRHCLCTILLGGMLAGCATTGSFGPGLYGQSSRNLNTATQAFLTQNYPRAREGFEALAGQTQNPRAVTAGIYGLACIGMATAKDVPSFLRALESLPLDPEGTDRFRHQNPELFIRGTAQGIRLMQKEMMGQAARILLLSQEKDRSDRTIKTLEQTIQHLKHQIQVLERIDRELQEKRNPS